MATLLVVKEQLAGFYSRFEAYLNAVLKFLLTLVALLIINADLGYMSKIDNGAIVLIVSLLCSFLPVNLIVIILAIFVLLHVYALSLRYLMLYRLHSDLSEIQCHVFRLPAVRLYISC